MHAKNSAYENTKAKPNSRPCFFHKPLKESCHSFTATGPKAYNAFAESFTLSVRLLEKNSIFHNIVFFSFFFCTSFKISIIFICQGSGPCFLAGVGHPWSTTVFGQVISMLQQTYCVITENIPLLVLAVSPAAGCCFHTVCT